jgi:hypothetical protein
MQKVESLKLTPKSAVEWLKEGSMYQLSIAGKTAAQLKEQAWQHTKVMTP